MKQTVYDLPTRLFHWLFATFFIAAFALANLVDDDSQWFAFHMLAGLMLCFTATLRVIWGFVGTKHARFSGLSLQPKDLVSYLKGILNNDLLKWAGHNPASSWATIIMLMLALGLAISGYLMASGIGSEFLEEIHEILSYIFMAVVILHICGIVLHSLRHREIIAYSMLSGKKTDISRSDVIDNCRRLVAILFLVLVFTFGFYLFKNYNSQNRTLSIFNNILQLGEREANEDDSEYDDED